MDVYVQVDIGYKVGGYGDIPSIVILLSKFKTITIHFKSKSIAYSNKSAVVIMSRHQNNQIMCKHHEL